MDEKFAYPDLELVQTLQNHVAAGMNQAYNTDWTKLPLKPTATG